MRHLRTISTTRLLLLLAATVALALSAGFAQAALDGSDAKPDPKPLDRAIHDAVNAPPVDGVSARVTFTNGLLPSGSLPTAPSPRWPRAPRAGCGSRVTAACGSSCSPRPATPRSWPARST